MTKQNADPADQGTDGQVLANVEEKRPTICAEVAKLVMDASLTYAAIVEVVLKTFPDASTTARSVASVAARLRKTGVDVPHRRAPKREAST